MLSRKLWLTLRPSVVDDGDESNINLNLGVARWAVRVATYPLDYRTWNHHSTLRVDRNIVLFFGCSRLHLPLVDNAHRVWLHAHQY